MTNIARVQTKFRRKETFASTAGLSLATPLPIDKDLISSVLSSREEYYFIFSHCSFDCAPVGYLPLAMRVPWWSEASINYPRMRLE